MNTESELVDDTTTYATPADVETYLRDMSFSSSSDPAKSEVEDLIAKASERIDKKTNRAWRTRKVSNLELNLELSHKQRSRIYNRAGRRYRSSGRYSDPPRKWAPVHLPHKAIESIDSIKLRTPYDEDDLTSDKGLDGDWTLDPRGGKVSVRASLISAVGRRSGSLHRFSNDEAKVRVTYKYGRTTGVPADIEEACAKLVAADIMDTDTYGDILPDSVDTTDPSEAATRLRDQAESIIDDYRYDPVQLI